MVLGPSPALAQKRSLSSFPEMPSEIRGRAADSSAVQDLLLMNFVLTMILLAKLQAFKVGQSIVRPLDLFALTATEKQR